jgi:predicted RNase H-like HicB family nuclease
LRVSAIIETVITVSPTVGGEMKLRAIIHKAEEGGWWAEVPAIPGCVTQGDTWDELLQNIREAITGRLSVDIEESTLQPDDTVLEVAV